MESKNEGLEILKTVVIAVIVALLIRTFIFNIARVNQTSMYPTLNNKDTLIASSFYKFQDNKKRGDIIIFKLPEEKRLLIKRIIALPNENVEIKDGKIYINGKLYEEDYLRYDTYTLSDITTFELKDDEYFVLGDNRTPGGSVDSRIFGPIKEDYIKSKAVFRIFPISNFGFLYK
ncbi:signal peptidase I [Peptoniphilus sp.]|jgi:signal peptidase I|uniref:signal peptidase I n=1 Tax=Peptoniphilus sp. TaxID=1971214 RepID=UPI003D8D152E